MELLISWLFVNFVLMFLANIVTDILQAVEEERASPVQTSSTGSLLDG